MFEIINFFIKWISDEASTQLNAYAKKLAFQKTGDIQNATTNNLIDKYSHLEDAITTATIQAGILDLKAEQEKKLLISNVVTLTICFLAVLILVYLLIHFSKK